MDGVSFTRYPKINIKNNDNDDHDLLCRKNN